jgi:hypothetical protein
MTPVEAAVGPRVSFPELQSTHTASVDWRWWLVRTSDLGKIVELSSAHSKNLKIMLNQAGSATFWLHLLDPLTEYVEEHTTSVICYRNTVPIWSGEVINVNEESSATSDVMNVTVMGWYYLFSKRSLHTGKEFIEEMLPKAIAEGRVTGYTEIGTESATQLTYGEYPRGSGIYQGVPMAVIAADLINRANIDVPTYITLGPIPETTNSINLPLQQFQNIGEQITKITNIESGFDWYIDPITRKFNMIRNTVRGNIVGLGVDRGSGVKFTYPGNCEKASRSKEGTKTINRVEAIGQNFNVGKSESLSSIIENGLFETDMSLSDVSQESILIAYATVEVATLEKPFTIISFIPKSVGPEDTVISGVPRPFEDYNLGDIVYCTIERGPKFIVGKPNPQPIRVYGIELEIDDNGREIVKSIQTTYAN